MKQQDVELCTYLKLTAHLAPLDSTEGHRAAVQAPERPGRSARFS